MHEVGWHYERSRGRIDGLLRSADDDTWNAPVAACPGWRARDVVAHLLGNTEDAAAGRLDGPPTEAQTRDQVDRHRDDDPVALLDAWAEAGPFVAAVVSQTEMWPAAIDAVSHEHDIRSAIGQPGGRDNESILELADLLRQFDPPRLLSIVFEDESLDPPADGTLRLETTPFELVRLRLGRRSQEQVEALAWSDDPTDVLPHLFIFGPSPTDLLE
ncbi:MAG TPA: maleylpyruvate isomerase family mycothiol-dependent enzyme [Acidimicrobiales bacterium]|nr:maleylpyruvate isomerase family mycothiol-dependent enzyme [Acidimicrobiales bacterium]